jgi:hypothetical protein
MNDVMCVVIIKIIVIMAGRKSDKAHALFGKKDFYADIELVQDEHDSDNSMDECDDSDQSMDDAEKIDYGEEDVSNDGIKEDPEIYEFFKKYQKKNKSAKSKRIDVIEKGNKYLMEEEQEDDEDDDSPKYKKFFVSSKGDDDDYGDLGLKKPKKGKTFLESVASKLLNKKEEEEEEEEQEEKEEITNQRVVLWWLKRDKNLPGFFSLLPSYHATALFPFHVMTRNSRNTENENLKILLSGDVPLVSFVMPLVQYLKHSIVNHIMKLIKSNVYNVQLPDQELLKHMIKLRQAKAIASILHEKGLYNMQYLFDYEQHLVNKLDITASQLQKITDMQIRLKDMLRK